MYFVFGLAVNTAAGDNDKIQRLESFTPQAEGLAHDTLYAIARHRMSNRLTGNRQAEARHTGVVRLREEGENFVARFFLRLVKNPLVLCRRNQPVFPGVTAGRLRQMLRVRRLGGIGPWRDAHLLSVARSLWPCARGSRAYVRALICWVDKFFS